MIQITSTFATTPIVPANSHGPYVVPGGSPITLSAGVPHPDATYAWDLGDGTTASTQAVTHTYGEDGIYVARLTVVVHRPGGARSRHFAVVQVTNVKPVVTLPPARTVNEGEVVSFSGSFFDPEWLDTHTATWFWGDSQAATAGVVTESHQPPAARGEVRGSHAWGDSGTYTVLLEVTDDNGAIGRATTQVEVLNVPPTVRQLPPMFAYPCSVLTLEAAFTDPGWLDLHVATWNFGDCSGWQTAVVREEHQPPAGTGVAIASHTYRRCGTYRAECEVEDDDGGIGRMATVVTVVEVENADFEHGFQGRQLGAVANFWEPYVAAIPAPLGGAGQAGAGGAAGAPGRTIFVAEELLVWSGRRAQRIRFAERGRAGIFQKVGANPEWDYQITVRYSLHEAAGGRSIVIDDADDPADVVPPAETGGLARLGIDPLGGDDPDAASVVWASGERRLRWEQLVVRATARARAVTIFLEGEGNGLLPVDLCFDAVTLTPVQPFCPPPPPPKRPEGDGQGRPPAVGGVDGTGTAGAPGSRPPGTRTPASGGKAGQGPAAEPTRS